MHIKEHVAQELDTLSEAELQQVAEYLAFLKFQARRRMVPSLDLEQVATLYAEFAEEDRQLAEEGIVEYHTGLLAEDIR